MRKFCCLLLIILMINNTRAIAQVVIGPDAAKPQEFSILELISTSSNSGGLRMPQFTNDQRDLLTRSATFQEEITGKAMGLTIFNTDTKCLEYWNGEKWISRCNDNSCPPQEMPGVITFSSLGPLKLNEEFTATIIAEPGVDYSWTVPPTFSIIGESTGNSITLKPTLPGVHGLYNIGVIAKNDCGNKSSWRAGTGFLETYNCEEAPKDTDIDVTNIVATNISAGKGTQAEPYEIIEGYIFTLSFPTDADNSFTYNWNLNTDGNKFFNIVSEGNSTITLRTNNQKVGETCSPEAIRIMASNDCGQTNDISSNLHIKIIPDPATCPQPDAPTSLTFSKTTLFVGETFTASVTDIPGTTYTWNVPSGFIVEEPKNTNQVTIRTTVLGTTQLSSFSVTASNDCGRTSEPTNGSGTLIVNDVSTLNPGTGAIIGKKCFDLARGNNNTNYCASLTKRTSQETDFSLRTPQNPAKGNVSAPYTGVQVYTYKPLTGSTVSNVRFMIQDSNNPKAVNSFTQNAMELTINFNEELNTQLAGLSRAASLKVIIYTIYTDQDGKDKKLETTLRLQDCACCGAATSTGWLNFECYNRGVQGSPDPFSYSINIVGDAYQWGRRADGHQGRYSNELSAIARSNDLDEDGQVKGEKYGFFLNSADVAADKMDWRTPAADNLWQDNIKTKGDPCPSGWKVPSEAQWRDVLNKNTKRLDKTSDGKIKGLLIGDFLYLPSTQPRMLRNYKPGQESTTGGEYWTSTAVRNSNTAYMMYFNSNNQATGDGGGITYRGQGRSVRCVEE